MNGTPAMNDDEVLAEVRRSLVAAVDSLDGVRMERPVEALVASGRARRVRRALAVRAAVACTAAAAVAAAVLVVTSRTDAEEARAVAYVTRRVENALASENLVFVGRSGGKSTGTSVTWAYGSASQSEQFWPTADYRDRVVNGQRLWDFPPRLRGKIASAEGTALVGGKLVSAYVTYDDRKYSLSALAPRPAGACSVTAALSMGSPPAVSIHWRAFIGAMLACGAAAVTGHVRIGGMEATKITGKPVTVRLPAGQARAVGATWATARWTLYVNPRTYLPVRITGSTETFGGPARPWISSSVTDVQWLPPTAANIARTLVTIPPGFRQVRSSADQS
jgi:hypothetical protein